MNPWDVLGWIIVGVVILIVLFFIVATVFGLVVAAKETKAKSEARVEAQKLEGLILPHFKSLKVGDLFSVDYANWRVHELGTEYLPEMGEHRLYITAKTIERH